MRNYTLFGVRDFMSEVSLELLKMSGHGVSLISDEKFDPRKFMSKTVILFGNLSPEDLLNLQSILSRIKTLVYVGVNGAEKNLIMDYIEEKDIPVIVENPGISSSIGAYYNNRQVFELYTSSVFSPIELVSKYLTDCGPKLCLMMRYLSQVKTGRVMDGFDHHDLRDLMDLEYEFTSYHDDCLNSNKTYDREELLEIFKKTKPI